MYHWEVPNMIVEMPSLEYNIPSNDRHHFASISHHKEGDIKLVAMHD